MVESRTLWLLLPRPVRRFPADLAAVVVLVGLTCLSVFVPGLNETPIRIVFGLPFALFLPGYAFIAALFPEAGESRDEDADERTSSSPRSSPPHEDADTDGTVVPRPGDGIDGLERVTLSFGLSIAITPLIGLVLNFTPWGIRLVPVVLSISGFILATSVIGAIRRWELPPEERFAVPYREWIAAGRTELFHPETRTDAVLNVVLVLSLLLAVGSVSWAVAVPKQGEAFTEFYLLTEDSNGDLVADDYPTEFTRGESRSLVVGIGNHEHRPVDYTVVVELQRVQAENNTTRVLEEQELQRFQASVKANETWTRAHDLSPTMTGERLRLAYLLYADDVPARPTTENAYREVHLWINVSRAE